MILLMWEILWPIALYELLTELFCMVLEGTQALVIRTISGSIALVILGTIYGRDRFWQEKNTNDKSVKTLKTGRVLTIIIFCMVGISSSLFCNNLITLSGLKDKFIGYKQVEEVLYSPPFWLQLVAMGVVVSGVEELIFRGFIYQSLRRRFVFWVAVVVSSILFGVYHGSLVQGTYACMVAFVLAWSREKYQSVLAPWVIHGSGNLTSIFLGKWIELEGKQMDFSFLFITICSGLCLFLAINIMRKRNDRRI